MAEKNLYWIRFWRFGERNLISDFTPLFPVAEYYFKLATSKPATRMTAKRYYWIWGTFSSSNTIYQLLVANPWIWSKRIFSNHKYMLDPFNYERNKNKLSKSNKPSYNQDHSRYHLKNMSASMHWSITQPLYVSFCIC